MLKSKMMSFFFCGETTKVQMTFKFYSNFQLKKNPVRIRIGIHHFHWTMKTRAADVIG